MFIVMWVTRKRTFKGEDEWTRRHAKSTGRKLLLEEVYVYTQLITYLWSKLRPDGLLTPSRNTARVTVTDGLSSLRVTAVSIHVQASEKNAWRAACIFLNLCPIMLQSITYRVFFYRSLVLLTKTEWKMLFGVEQQGRRQGRGAGLPSCSPPLNPPNRNLKNTDFVDIMISKVFHHFHFSRNQPLKSAGD
jgi:hypothetical protein